MTGVSKRGEEMTHQSHELALSQAALDSQLRDHPLPWRIDRGWAFEVIASDDAIVAKCPTNEEAEAIVSLAERRSAEQNQAA